MSAEPLAVADRNGLRKRYFCYVILIGSDFLGLAWDWTKSSGRQLRDGLFPVDDHNDSRPNPHLHNKWTDILLAWFVGEPLMLLAIRS